MDRVLSSSGVTVLSLGGCATIAQPRPCSKETCEAAHLKHRATPARLAQEGIVDCQRIPSERAHFGKLLWCSALGVSAFRRSEPWKAPTRPA